MVHCLSCCVLALLIALVACKKQPAKAEKAASTAPVIASTPVLEGFSLASRVPHEVEGFVSSSRGAEHWQALQATHAWQRWSNGKEALKLPLDDVCVAVGPGFAEAMHTLRPLGQAWSTVAARGWLGKTILGKAIAWNDLAAMDEVILALERFELPLLLVGLKGAEAHDWMKQMAGPLFAAPWFADAPVSMITTTQGEQIALTEVDAAQVLTAAWRKEWLAAFAAASQPELDATMREKIAHALDVLAGKTFVIAVGKGKDSAWIGIASTKEQLRLADAPEDSVLALPELQFISQHQNKPLIGLAMCRGAVLDALEEEPLAVPVLRDVLRGWENVPVASAFAPALLAAMPEAMENKHAPRRDAAAVAWCEEGLHIDARGGVSREEIAALDKTSRFTTAIEGDKVLLASAGHRHGGEASWESAKGWIGLLHAGALAYAESGLAGPKENLLWAKFLSDAVPASREIWESGQGLIQKGLDEDGAFVLDAGGVMPALPGLPKGGEQVALPRVCWMGGIQNRAMISTAWLGIETGLTHLLAALPAQPPPRLPPAEVWREKSLVAHFYMPTFGSDDLLLSATLDEKTLLFGSSRIQQMQLGRLVSDEKAPAASPGDFFRLDVSRLHAWLSRFAEVRAKNGGAESLNAFLNFIEPFGDLRLRTWAQGGVIQHRLSWQMKDVAAP
jgi:hypothetical protein